MSDKPDIKADLHVHSVYSDGRLSPEELCLMAEEAGLTHIALCDHDTFAGVGPMGQAVGAFNDKMARERRREPLLFLPGVEMSAGAEGRSHILGYGADAENPALREALESAEAHRLDRFSQMREKLAALGVEIPPECFPQELLGPLGRGHLARALVNAGVVHTVRQAFGRYLGEGKPAYVSYLHKSPREAVALLRGAGAVPVLAHPYRMGLREPALFGMIRALQDGGLMGVEVYHPSASERQIRSLEAFARGQGLLVTGGSDFHGDEDSPEALGKFPQGWVSMKGDVQALLAHMRE